MHLRALAASALLACLAFGQSAAEQSREFHLVYAASDRDANDAAVAIRTITEMRQVQARLSTKSVTARGTADQLALAEWMLVQLDRPASEDHSTPMILFACVM
jgi:hypothetical protein